MALIVVIHNDGTGTDQSANYDVEVLLNRTILWRGRVCGHNRADGWPALLSMVADRGPAYVPK